MSIVQATTEQGRFDELVPRTFPSFNLLMGTEVLIEYREWELERNL